MMHRTTMGVDQHYKNITKQASRTALSDGWGGSMVSTEISDILFGTPSPITAGVNMGVLKKDMVNIIIHGHEPNLFESMLISVNEKTFVDAAKAAGAQGINLVGMCVTFPTIENTKFHNYLFDGLEGEGLGKWGHATDPMEMARKMIAHIDKKRKALGIDKGRERVLVDMADRRGLA